MNGQLSIPTGQGKYPRDPAGFETVTLETSEILTLTSHPKIDKATNITLFLSPKDDVARAEAIMSAIAKRVSFKGEVTKQVTRAGTTMLRVARRGDLDVDALYAALVETPVS